MSRVDDGDAAKRRADLRAAEKSAQQHKAERRAVERNSFAKSLDRGALETKGERARQGRVARSATLSRHDTVEEPVLDRGEADGDHPDLAKAKARDASTPGSRADVAHDPEAYAAGGEDGATQANPDAAARQASPRRVDSKGVPKGEKPATAARGGDRTTARAEDEPRGGKDNRGQGEGKQPQGSFKIPSPALMAPPPVAVPKEDPGLARMRAVAQEIISRIVESVRVGANADGLPEFQIELRSSILAGLHIKVASNRGRIRATFLAKDRAVLRALRAGARDLEAALVARGLPVEALEFEEG
jgi:hypothetical protein